MEIEISLTQESEHSGYPKSAHLKTGIIWKPDFLKIVFWNGWDDGSPNHLKTGKNDIQINASLNHLRMQFNAQQHTSTKS